MDEHITSDPFDKKAHRMKILTTLKVKKEKENIELKKIKALKQKKEQEKLKKEKEELKKEETIKIINLKKEKRNKFFKKSIISIISLFIFSFILFLPKVNEIKYQSLEGASTIFYVNFDLLGIYDNQIVDNKVYDSININEDKSKISFCSIKHKNVECFDTLLIEKKSILESLPNYLFYLKDKYSFI